MQPSERTPNEEFEIQKVKKNARKLTIGCSVATFVLGGLLGAGLLYQRYKIYDDPNIQKLVQVYNIMVNDWYYGGDDISDEVTLAAIEAMLSTDDPYTFYTSTREEQNLSMNQSGYGFRCVFYGGEYYVTYVYKDSPCQKAGLLQGDIIVASWIEETQDWITLKDVTAQESRNAIQNRNETLRYRIRRDQEMMELSFERGNYSYHGAKITHTEISDDHLIVSLQIDTFLDEQLARHVEELLDDVIQTYQRNISRLVIDLRGNGGGYVSQAVELAGLFVPKGSTIMQYIYKDGSRESLVTTHNRKYQIPEFYILQDSNSASASESFTMAMKELTNTKVIGTRSYGKGIVQSLYYLKDGSAVRCTIAGCLSPQGVSIHGVGIVPDIDLQDAFRYFGEKDELNEEEEIILLRSIGRILSEDFEDISDAVLSFQKTYSLEETGELDVLTAQMIQKLTYQWYLDTIAYYQENWVVA